MAKKLEERTKLREKFDAKGFGLISYAQAHNLCRTRLGNVLNDKVKLYTYEVMKVFLQLKEDGVYTDEVLPWEEPKKSA